MDQSINSEPSETLIRLLGRLLPSSMICSIFLILSINTVILALHWNVKKCQFEWGKNHGGERWAMYLHQKFQQPHNRHLFSLETKTYWSEETFDLWCFCQTLLDSTSDYLFFTHSSTYRVILSWEYRSRFLKTALSPEPAVVNMWKEKVFLFIRVWFLVWFCLAGHNSAFG